MEKILFEKTGDDATVVLENEAEVFTNCSQIIVTRIVNGEKILNYADITKNKSTILPAGSYEFNSVDCKECWVSYEERSAISSETHVEINC